jgi:hypothetical protein
MKGAETPAISLQSLAVNHRGFSRTLNAVRALYVLEYTFYSGFESHSLRHIFVIALGARSQVVIRKKFSQLLVYRRPLWT